MASTAIVVRQSAFCRRSVLLFFDNFDDFAAFIFSAARADAVRAAWAHGSWGTRRAPSGQRIVSAARGSAALGMTSFWIGHDSSYLI